MEEPGSAKLITRITLLTRSLELAKPVPNDIWNWFRELKVVENTGCFALLLILP